MAMDDALEDSGMGGDGSMGVGSERANTVSGSLVGKNDPKSIVS